MKNWFSNLFGPRAEPPQSQAADPSQQLDLETELQKLRIELEARDESIRRLQQEVERLRARQTQVVEETTSAQIQALFADLAGPSSQILTQADLLENQGKPVQARDVLTIARRMVKVLERHGVSFEGPLGKQVDYDPNLHTPLNSSSAPQPGQPVSIRFAGARYKSKIIYKSVVE